MPGTFIAYLDVAALERRFPLFPDGSDGIFEHAAPLTGFFQSLFGTGPDTPDSGFTDGSDGSFYPTRTRERKTPNENKDDVFHDNYYFVRRPDVGKKASDPSEPPKSVFSSLRSDLDRIAADLAGATRIAQDIKTYGSRRGDGLDPWKGDIRNNYRHAVTAW